MPSTFAHAMFPSASVFIARKAFPTLTRVQVLKLLCLAVFLGNSPDLDLIPASIFVNHWTDIHREWGHNIFSLTLLTWMGSWLLRTFVSKDITPRQAWFVSAGLVWSHIFLDSLGDYDVTGVRPEIPIFYPFSDWAFNLPFRLFPCAHVDPHVHRTWAFVISGHFWSEVLLHEVFYSAVLVALWSAVYFGTRYTARAMKRQAKTKAATSLREAA